MLLGCRPYEDVSLESSGHNTVMFWSADIIREMTFRRLVAGESGLYHARTVVYDHRLGYDQIIGLHRSEK